MQFLRIQIHQFFYTLLAFPRAWQFMVNHRLWVGLRQYGWVARALVLGGIVLAIAVITDALDWMDRHQNDGFSAFFVGDDSLLQRWWTTATESLTEGTLNFVILVLLEVVIFHFMRRTLSIVLERENTTKTDFKPFFDAQVRMLLMSMFAAIFTTVISMPLNDVIDGWLGIRGGQRAFTSLLNVFFLGFLIADNYNEQFELSIEQSWRQIWRHYVGICLGLGVPLWLMLKVPLFGTVLGPLVTSVTAAIVLRELTDLHLIGYRMTEKEQAKYDKKQAKKQAKLAKKEAKRAAKAARL